jgi:hypothetical protein
MSAVFSKNSKRKSFTNSYAYEINNENLMALTKFIS